MTANLRSNLNDIVFMKALGPKIVGYKFGKRICQEDINGLRTTHTSSMNSLHFPLKRVKCHNIKKLGITN